MIEPGIFEVENRGHLGPDTEDVGGPEVAVHELQRKRLLRCIREELTQSPP
jgi:hypothetical protein